MDGNKFSLTFFLFLEGYFIRRSETSLRTRTVFDSALVSTVTDENEKESII